MSQMPMTSRALSVPARPNRSTSSTASPLRLIPGAIRTSNNGVFAAACIALMVAGLMMLLILNTLLAQGAFAQHDANRQLARLVDSEGQLRAALATQATPGSLAAKASALGMVRPNGMAFVDVTKGTVTGVSKPATSASALTVITSPTKAPLPGKAAKPKSTAATITSKPVAVTPSTTKPTTATSTAKPSATKPTTTKPATTTATKPTATKPTTTKPTN